jgi:hypothetical protein
MIAVRSASWITVAMERCASSGRGRTHEPRVVPGVRAKTRMSLAYRAAPVRHAKTLVNSLMTVDVEFAPWPSTLPICHAMQPPHSREQTAEDAACLNNG